jgi:hypothetical protein
MGLFSNRLQKTVGTDGIFSRISLRCVYRLKAFERKNIASRLAFGYGLTYTTFNYSNLEIDLIPGTDTGYVPRGMSSTKAVYPRYGISLPRRGSRSLVWAGSCEEGCAIVYWDSWWSGEVLRRFDKIFIQPGQSEVFTFGLNRQYLSSWDVERQV